MLERAPLDGFASGPAIAAEAQSLLTRAQAGDPAAAAQADRLLSAAWVHYVQTIQRPATGMTYKSTWVERRVRSPHDILALAAAAPSLASYVRTVSDVNPFYARLREAAWQQMQSTGAAPIRAFLPASTASGRSLRMAGSCSSMPRPRSCRWFRMGKSSIP